MKELRRLQGESTDAFEQELLGSWRKKGPTTESREQAWSGLVALGAGSVGGAAAAGGAAHVGAAVAGKASIAPAAAASTASSGAAATATVSKGTWLVASTVKWLVTGAVASAAVGTAAVAIRSSSPTTTPSHEVAEQPRAAAQPAPPRAQVPSRSQPAPVAPTPPVATVETVAPAPAIALPAHPAAVAAQPTSGETATSTPTTAADEHMIGKQVAYLDEARSALTVGDASKALESPRYLRPPFSAGRALARGDRGARARAAPLRQARRGRECRHALRRSSPVEPVCDRDKAPPRN